MQRHRPSVSVRPSTYARITAAARERGCYASDIVDLATADPEEYSADAARAPRILESRREPPRPVLLSRTCAVCVRHHARCTLQPIGRNDALVAVCPRCGGEP